MKKEKVCACNDEKCACGKKNILVIAIITLAVLLVVAVGFIVYPLISKASYLGKWEHNVTFDNNGSAFTYYESLTFNKNKTFDYLSKAEGEEDQTITGTYRVVGNEIYLNIENNNNVSSTFAIVENGKFCLGEKNCKAYFVKEKSKESKDIDLREKEEETTTTANKVEKNEKAINLYVFHGETCPHCQELLAWLDTLEADSEYGAMFKIVKYEVWNDTNNSALMGKVAKKLNVEASGVPFIVIGDKSFTGYAESSNEEIKAAIKEQFNNKKYKDIVAKVK